MIGSRSESSLLLGALRVVAGLDTAFLGAATTSVALSLLTSGFLVVFFATGASGASTGFGAVALVARVVGATVVGVLVLAEARVGLVDMVVVQASRKPRRDLLNGHVRLFTSHNNVHLVAESIYSPKAGRPFLGSPWSKNILVDGNLSLAQTRTDPQESSETNGAPIASFRETY